MSKTRDLAQAIRAELAKDPKLLETVERERFCADLATQLLEARANANLTQKQLAERASTHQSVIARLEDADYSGHSLAMLWRLARAMGSRLSVSFHPSSVRVAEEPIEVVNVFRPISTETATKTSVVHRGRSIASERNKIYRIRPVATFNAIPDRNKTIQLSAVQ